MKKLILIAVFLFALSSVAAAAPLMDFDKGKVALDYTYRPSLDFNGTGEIRYQINPIYCEPKAGTLSKSHNFDGDANLDLGLTFGIGNKWGLQYRQYNPAGTIWSGRLGYGDFGDGYSEYEYLDLSFDGKIRSDEFNLLYGFDKNWAAFVGVVRSSASIKTNVGYSRGYSDGDYGRSFAAGASLPELKSDDKNVFHFGVVGSYKIADKTNLWGLASFGSDYRNWEAGISYDIGKDVQLNVNYRDTKWSKLAFGSAHATWTRTDYVDDSETPVTRTGTASADVTSDVTVKGWGFGITYKF